MKIKLNSKELHEKLQYLSTVVNSTNTMPILDNFLFEVEGTELKITASDLDNTMIAKMPVESQADCKLAIPSRMLLDILKLLPSQPIELISSDNNQIEIISASGNYSVAYYDGAEFPRSKEINNPDSITIPTAILDKAIKKTLFACGSDDLRPVMSAVLFQLKSTSITFAATDSHRLVKYSRTDFTSETDVDFVVPKKPLGILKGILGNISDENVQISYNENNASFTFGVYELKVRLVDGKYPNYEAVIPKNNPNSLTIDTAQLIGSLKRVSIFSNKTTHQIALKTKGNSLNITAERIIYNIAWHCESVNQSFDDI